MQDVKSVLTPEQSRTFDVAHADPLFGPTTGANVNSFSAVTTSSDTSDD